MMASVAPLFLLLLTAQAPLGDQPATDRPSSDIERELDRAQENLVKAQTFTCQHDGADDAYAPVGRQFELAQERAKRALGRELYLDIWLNSCRKSGDGSEFRELLDGAERHIRK